MRIKKTAAAALSFLIAASSLPVFDENVQVYAESDSSAEKKVYAFGDVDGDGEISSADASLVLSEYGNVSTGTGTTLNLEQVAAADIDDDSEMTANDASMILKYYSYFSTGGTLGIKEFYDEKTVVSTTLPATTTSTTKSGTTTTTGSAGTTTTSTTKSGTTTTTGSAGTTTTSTTKSGTTTTTGSAGTTTTSTTKSATTTTTTKATTTSTTSAPTTTTTTKTTTTSAPATTTTTTEVYTKVSGIRLKRTTIALEVGYGCLAEATILPTDAKDKSLTWTSSDETVASVDEVGWIIALNEGSCVITCTSNDDPSISASLTVNVTDSGKVTALRMQKSTIDINVGEGDMSAVTFLPDSAYDKRAVWSISDESVASVDSEGWVIGKKAGTCILTVSSLSNPEVTGTVKVVVHAVTTVSTDEATTTTTSTTTATTSATTTTEPFSTSTLALEGVSDIRISRTEVTLNVGDGSILTATLLPVDADNNAVTWSSSDEAVATVDKNGWVKAVADGSCVITASSVSNPAVSAQVKVTVVDRNKVTGIRLSKTSLSIRPGEWDTATVTLLPANATELKTVWTVSDDSVATVDQQGVITGKNPGTCVVTVTSISNPDVTAEIQVTVYADTTSTITSQETTSTTTTSSDISAVTTTTSPDRVSSIDLSTDSVTLMVGKGTSVTASLLPETAKNRKAIWSSSAKTVAIVNSDGYITAVGVGTCVITVKSEDNPLVKATINVTVTDTEVTTSTATTTETTSTTTETVTTPTITTAEPYILFSLATGGMTADVPLTSRGYGRFVMDFILTDESGNVTSVETPLLILPDMTSVNVMLPGTGKNVSLTVYITNLANNKRAVVGSYTLNFPEYRIKTSHESIVYALLQVDGLKY